MSSIFGKPEAYELCFLIVFLGFGDGKKTASQLTPLIRKIFFNFSPECLNLKLVSLINLVFQQFPAFYSRKYLLTQQFTMLSWKIFI